MPGEVPKIYVPQIQLSLEVLDLETCHFVQYRPENMPFQPEELDVTVVQRDREWFHSNLTLFQKFVSDVNELKDAYDSILATIIPEQDEKPSPKAKRKKGMDFLVGDYESLKEGSSLEKVLEVGI